VEAYKVSATLELRDLVGPRLANLIKDMQRLEQATNSAKRRLRDFGAEASGIRKAGSAVRAMQKDMILAEQNLAKMGAGFKSFNASNMTGGIKGVHGELQRAQASAASLTAELSGVGIAVPELRSAASAIGRMDRNLAGASRNANQLVAHLHGVANALRGMPNTPNIPRGGFGGGGGHGGGGFHGGNAHVGTHGFGVGGVGLGIGAGLGAAAIGGYLGYEGMKASVNSAADYQREQALFRMFGMSETQNQEAFRFAKSMNAPGASMIDSLRYVTEAQGVFRESGMQGDEALAGSKLVAPILAKLHYASALTGHPMDETGEKSMLRFVEMRGGLKDPTELNRIADLGFKVSTTSGGNVDWEQMRQAMRTGGVAAKNLSDEALFAWGEPLIGELKGGGFGTGLRTAYNRMNGNIRLPNQAFHEMQKLGLWDPKMVVENKQGGIKSFNGNPLLHSEEYATNPFQYYQKYIMPKYDEMKLSTSDRNRENSMLFGGTGAMLFSTLEQQMSTILRSLPALNAAKPLDAAVKEQDKTYLGEMQKFDSAWSDFKTVFGTSVLPAATGMLQVGVALLRSAKEFADHPLDTAFGWIKKYSAEGQGMNPYDAGPGAASKPDPIAPASAAPVQVRTAVNLDGRTIADVVTNHQVRNMRTNASGGGFDFGLGLPSVGMK